MSNAKESIIKLCKRIIRDNKYDYYNSSDVCGDIYCVGDNCPFNSDTAHCLLCSENERLEIARQYLKDNEVDLEEENKMEKTFREVIADIKDGEVWKSHNKIIKCKNGDISIKGNLTIDSEDTMVFNKIIRYHLERKKYSFVDILAIENQGKEIESLVSGNKYIINKDEILFITEDGRHIKYSKDQHVFTLNEIQGEWYINN